MNDHNTLDASGQTRRPHSDQWYRLLTEGHAPLVRARRTRMLRKALTVSGSGGVVSVTVGLSAVGSPPSLRISHVLAS
jgi:hypothetical protein